MNINYLLIICGVLFQLYGATAYVDGMFRGYVKPNMVSWFLWGVIPCISAYVMFVEGAVMASIPVLAIGIIPFIIFVLTLLVKDAYWRLGVIDVLCGLLAIGAMFMWFITRDPFLTVLFSLLAEFLSAVPTLIKTYTNPETESAISARNFTGRGRRS